VTVYAALSPATALREDGVAPRVKSGGAGMISSTVAVRVYGPLVPVTVSGCEPGGDRRGGGHRQLRRPRTPHHDGRVEAPAGLRSGEPGQGQGHVTGEAVQASDRHAVGDGAARRGARRGGGHAQGEVGCRGEPLIGSQDVEAPVPEVVVHAAGTQCDRGALQRGLLAVRGDPGEVVSRREDGQDPGRPKAPQVGLEVQAAARTGRRPGRVDDIGCVRGRRVPVGVEQPLEAEMDACRGGRAAVVEDLHRDPGGVGCDPDGGAAVVAADHDAHRLGAVAVHVGRRRRVLAVGVVPAVRSAPPLAGQVGVRRVDTGVHVRDDDPLAAESLIPHRGRIDERHVGLDGGRRRGGGSPGLRSLDGEVRLYLADVRSGRDLLDHRGGGAFRDLVGDPQRDDAGDPALRSPRGEQPQRVHRDRGQCPKAAARGFGSAQLEFTSGGRSSVVALREIGSQRYFGTAEIDAPGPIQIDAVLHRAGQRVAVPVSWQLGPPPSLQQQQAGSAPRRRLAPYVDGLALVLVVAAAIAGAGYGLRRRSARRSRPVADVVGPPRQAERVP